MIFKVTILLRIVLSFVFIMSTFSGILNPLLWIELYIPLYIYLLIIFDTIIVTNYFDLLLLCSNNAKLPPNSIGR
jgi:hypothetical protein